MHRGSRHESESVRGEGPPARETEEQDADLDVPSPSEYLQFISGNLSYERLLDNLRRETTLERSDPDVMQTIREKILQAIPTYRSRRVGREEPSEGCTVVYHVDWNPFDFLAEQEYEEPGKSALANAITLTGFWRDAQALSSRETSLKLGHRRGPVPCSFSRTSLYTT